GRRLPAGFHLVGDSIFPGQSTLAVAAGGMRVADSILARVALEPARVPEADRSVSQGSMKKI
ncbi:MAG: hypothetical protein AAGG01_08060, partial [Planctomycetota bacterium]